VAGASASVARHDVAAWAFVDEPRQGHVAGSALEGSTSCNPGVNLTLIVGIHIAVLS
jgi:hypothetical protein